MIIIIFIVRGERKALKIFLEILIPSKNRLSFKQYIKDKPVKWGIKSFMLCYSEKITPLMQRYILVRRNHIQGVRCSRYCPDSSSHPCGCTQQRPRPRGQFLQLCDIDHLHRNLKMLAVGTAMANRKHYPKQQKKKQMCERGLEVSLLQRHYCSRLE